MKNEKQLISKKTSSPESYYFALQSSWGLTKHMGGLKATNELIALCHIDRASRILDVGCGVGITACYITKEHGSKLVAIDISEDMIERVKERAERKGVKDKIELVVADAQDLPFKDALFDAVVSESVNVFIKNRQKAINEYKRVAKPGAYVGFNEVTWVETPPPELVEYLSLALGGAQFLTSRGWKGLLEEAGLSDITIRTYKTTAWNQWANEVKQIDLRDFLDAWRKFLFLYFRSQEVRRYMKEISKPPKSIFRVFKYLGYGIYVGRK